MKKLLLALSAALLIGSAASAQTLSEQIAASKDRCENLQKLCDNYKRSGNANVDGFGDAVNAAAVMAIANSAQLEDMYKRQIGSTEDGVTDVTIVKPTLDEWIAFGTTVAGESIAIKTASDKSQAVADEVAKLSKSKSPKAIKTAKAAKDVSAFGTEALKILGEESVAQAAAVKQIIETLKSGGNL